MHEERLEVLEAISRWHENPKKIESLVRQGRAPRVKLPPQVTWTLLGLMGYRQRNRWAWRTLRRQLEPALTGHRGGTTVHKMDGIVPRMSDWSFHFDTGLSHFTNRLTGERLHVHVGKGPDVINSFLFRDHIVTRHRPSPTQCRLVQLFPDGRGMVPALYGLRAAGMFRVFMDFEDFGLHFKLCRQLALHDRAVRAFLNAWGEESNRATLGALIGDHCAVAEIAAAGGNSQLAEKARAQAADSQRRWLSLLRYLAGNHLDEDLLWALVEAEPEEFLEYLTAAMSDADLAKTAEEILESYPSWRQHFEVVSS